MMWGVPMMPMVDTTPKEEPVTVYVLLEGMLLDGEVRGVFTTLELAKRRAWAAAGSWLKTCPEDGLWCAPSASGATAHMIVRVELDANELRKPGGTILVGASAVVPAH